MRKLFITVLLFGGWIPGVALAQNYYDPGYYNNNNAGYYNNGSYQQQQAAPQQQRPYFSNTNYYAPPPVARKQERDIGQVSVGADYVVGYASYKTVDFKVDSALTGGQDFVSDTRDFDRSFNSVSLNLGWRPLRNLGIEAFYSTSLSEKKVAYTESYTHYPEFARGEYEVSYRAYGIDLLGYLPINDYIEFIASIGVGKYDAEAKVKVVAYEDTSYNNLKSTSKSFNDSSLAYRLGGGMQIWLSKHLTFRAMLRWTQVGGDFMDYITEINAGVRYHF